MAARVVENGKKFSQIPSIQAYSFRNHERKLAGILGSYRNLIVGTIAGRFKAGLKMEPPPTTVC